MSKKAFKIVLLLKRRPDLSMEEFQRYYEEVHVPLCLKYMTGITRYMRRFLEPQPNPEVGLLEDLPFDVITELWFDDEAIFRGAVKYLSTSLMPVEVIEDEKNLFDRSKSRMATVIAECETALAGAGATS